MAFKGGGKAALPSAGSNASPAPRNTLTGCLSGSVGLSEAPIEGVNPLWEIACVSLAIHRDHPRRTNRRALGVWK